MDPPGVRGRAGGQEAWHLRGGAGWGVVIGGIGLGGVRRGDLGAGLGRRGVVIGGKGLGGRRCGDSGAGLGGRRRGNLGAGLGGRQCGDWRDRLGGRRRGGLGAALGKRRGCWKDGVGREGWLWGLARGCLQRN